MAFRTPKELQYRAWDQHLSHVGPQGRGEVDRHAFRSLYFREPGGVSFKIATDGPGSGLDEDPATLGEETILPSCFKEMRTQILAGLKPINWHGGPGVTSGTEHGGRSPHFNCHTGKRTGRNEMTPHPDSVGDPQTLSQATEQKANWVWCRALTMRYLNCCWWD